MWITQGLQGHSSHSITTVHYGRRDSRQEGWTVKTSGDRSEVAEEEKKSIECWCGLSQVFAWIHVKARAGRRIKLRETTGGRSIHV